MNNIEVGVVIHEQTTEQTCFGCSLGLNLTRAFSARILYYASRGPKLLCFLTALY